MFKESEMFYFMNEEQRIVNDGESFMSFGGFDDFPSVEKKETAEPAEKENSFEPGFSFDDIFPANISNNTEKVAETQTVTTAETPAMFDLENPSPQPPQVNEIKAEEAEEVVETVSAETEEVQNKPKRHRRTKEEMAAARAAKAAETVAIADVMPTEKVPETKKEKENSFEPVVSNNNIVMMPVDTNSIDIEKVIVSLGIMPSIGYESYHKEIEDKMKEIKVSKNLDPANIMLLNDRIDELSDIIFNKYAIIKSFYDNTIREGGIIPSVKKLNGTGANEAERNKNAVVALMNYKTPEGVPCNLIQVGWAAQAEFNFMEMVLNQVENKRRLVKSQSDAMAMKR